MLSLVSALLLAYTVCVNADPNRDNCISIGFERTVVCSYTPQSNSSEWHIFTIPAGYTNMHIWMRGSSGGASLNAQNNLDPSTRGLALNVRAIVSEGLVPGSKMFFLTGPNGESATTERSGRQNVAPNDTTIASLFAEPQNDIWAVKAAFANGGAGGDCPANSVARYAGAGGSATAAIYQHGGIQAHIYLGGGGGAGGYKHPTLKSHGGNAGPLYFNAHSGNSGTPKEPSLGGLGGHRKVHNSTTIGMRGGQGESGSGKSTPHFCYAAGGGGGGPRGGDGGKVYESEYIFRGVAGAGGSGSSFFTQNAQIFNVVEQHQIYHEQPGVFISYQTKPRQHQRGS